MKRFHFKHFSLSHDKSTMKVGTDAVLLGAWVNVAPSDWALDIGTGCGIIPLMLAQKGVAKVHAVDLDAPSAREAAENFDASQWHDRLFSFHADVRNFTMQCAYDLIISNPPFFVNSFKCDADRRNQARHTDTSLTFVELIDAVRRLLKSEGRFVVVLPLRESLEFIPLAEQSNLFVHRRQNIIPVAGKDPNRVNLEFRYGQPAQLEATDLVIRTEDGSFTEDYDRVVSEYYLG